MPRSFKGSRPSTARAVLCASTFIICIACVGAQAVVLEWTGANGVNWSDNLNWNPATVPTSLDTALFNSGNANCLLDVSATVGGIRFTSGYSGDFNFPNMLSVLGNADFRTNGAILTNIGILEFAGSTPQNFIPKANAYTANQIRQNGPGGTHVKVNGFQCVNLNLMIGVLYLDTTSADSVAGTFTNSGSGGLHFGVSTLKFAGQYFNLGALNTLIPGTGTLEFCKEASPRQEFTPLLYYTHPRILHSGSDTLLQLNSLRCNAFEQTKGTYNINGFRDTIVSGNFSIINGDSISLAGLASCYIVLPNGGTANFSGKSLDSLKMMAGSTWYVNVYNGGFLTAQYAKLQNCNASGASPGYATLSQNIIGNANWNFPPPNLKTWNNITIGGKWSVAANWAPPGLPSTTDTVFFNNAYPCTLDIRDTIPSLRFGSIFGSLDFFHDTLCILDTANFSGIISGSIIPRTGALEFIGSNGHALFPKAGINLPLLIQNGAGMTLVKAPGFKSTGLVVKNGTFNGGIVAGDTINGLIYGETGGTLELGTAAFYTYGVIATSGGVLNFMNGSLTITGPTSNYMQFSTVIPGTGMLSLQQTGSWEMFYPPINAQLPPIHKSGGDSLVLGNALTAKALYLLNGAWHWGGGGHGHVVDTLQTGNNSRMHFSFSAYDTVKTLGNVNLSGLAATGGMTAGAGVIVFAGAGTQTLSPLVGTLLPDIRHFGPGTLTLFGNLLCASFHQNNGMVNTAGFNITASGNFSIANGTASTILGLGTGTDSITAASASLKGLPGDLLNLNRPNTWKLRVNGQLFADYVNLGDCNATCSTGFANNSINTGSNPNWKFGKFWRGSSGDIQWATANNWAPPAAPLASDSVLFDNSAMYGCVLNTSATIRAITFTSGCTPQFDFGTSALTVTGTADLRSSGTIVPGTGALIFEGTSPQTMTPKYGEMHPAIICNNYSGLSISGNPLKAYSLTLKMGAISFNDAAIFNDSIGAVFTTAGGGVRGLDLGNDTLSVEGPVDLSASSVSSQPAAALRFFGNATQNFQPSFAVQHPNIIHSGSGVLNQTGSLKCNSFLQTAGTYNMGGFQDTVTDGDFTVANGSASSMTGLDNAAIVVSSGNANFTGQAGSRLNLSTASPWRLNVSGAKTAHYANIGNCDASGGSAGIPVHCSMGSGNINWDSSVVAPRLFDTTGSPAYLSASQRKDGSDTIDLFYQIKDSDDALDTISLHYRNGLSGTWATANFVSGDVGIVSTGDFSLHRHIRWHVVGQLGNSFLSDSVQLMVVAVDAFNNKTSLMTPNKGFMTSTGGPVVSSAALIAPNGNEKIQAGEPLPVLWDLSGISAEGGQLKNSPITLSYSLDNGATFPSIIAANAANSGSYSWTTPALTSTSVRIRIAVIDTFGHSGYDTSNAPFTVDSTKPVSSVTYPLSGTAISSLASITGTARDSIAGVASVDVMINDQTGSLFWNGAAWSATPGWIMAQGTGSWATPSPPLTNGDIYVVRSRATDNANNTETSPASVSFTYAPTSPTAPAIAFAGAGVATNNPSVSLTVFAANSDSMHFRLDAGAWSAWEPYATSRNSFLISSGGQGMRKVSVEFKDRAGNVSSQVSDSILYDTTLPTTSVATRGLFDARTWPGMVSGTASDSLSGVRSVYVRIRNETGGVFWNGSSWGADSAWVIASGTVSWRSSLRAAQLGRGRYSVVACAVDSAGNKGAQAADSFSFSAGIMNNLSVTAAAIGDSAISVSWKTDSSDKRMKNVLFGLGHAGSLPDTDALTSFPYRDTSFVVSNTVAPGIWYAVTLVLDSIGGSSPLRKDSVSIMNTPPRLAAVRDTVIDEGQPWLGVLSASDVNGDSLRFRIQTAPPGLFLDSVLGTMQWTPGASNVGSFVCVVAAHDSRGGSALDSFTIIVRIVNRSPTITFIGDSIAREDSLFTARIQLSDPNPGDSAWFSAIRIPLWLMMVRDTFHGTPGASDVGIDTLTVVAKDKGGLFDTLSRRLIVIHTNHPPVVASWNGPDSLRQYGRGQWVISAIDRDRNDSLKISWQSKPQWMSLTQAANQGTQWQFVIVAAPLSTEKGWFRFAYSVHDASSASPLVQDSVFVVSLPTTAIDKKQIAFGALRYGVSGGNGIEPAAAFEASLRYLDDTTITFARKSRDGSFEFYPLMDGRYEFQARAIDANGLRDTFPPRDVAVISGASRHTFAATSWTMVSIPSVAYSIAGLAGGGPVLHWDETSGEEDIYRYYRRETAADRTVPGLSYWRKSSDTLTIALASDDFSDSAFSLRLSKGSYGWNQVASPYSYPVQWPSAATIWKWNNTTNDYEDADGILEPWQGYWVIADSATTLRLEKAPEYASGSVSKRSTAYFTGSADWRIRVSLFAGDGNDADNTFGFSPRARDGYDIADRPEPPRIAQSGYAYFWHPEWDRGVSEFASDIRNRMKKVNAFQIAVTASAAQSKPARIRFNGIEKLSNLYCYFADPDTVFLIEGNKDYELAPSASTAYKTVFVTADRQYLKKFPLHFALSPPFPNPCRSMAAISYALPFRFAKDGLLNERPFSVRLALYDAMGRRVRRLIDREQEPGLYRIVWDGKSAGGRLAAPGAYFCRLEANEYSSTVRLTMMR